LIAAMCVGHGAAAAEARPSQPPQLDLLGIARAMPSRITNDADIGVRLDDLRYMLQAKSGLTTSDLPADRDEAVARKRSDTLWSIERGLKEKPSLDLTSIGFRKVRDGVYEVSGAGKGVEFHVSRGPAWLEQSFYLRPRREVSK